jgi:fluoride exporter
MMLRDILYVAGGSAIGGVLRWLAGRTIRMYIQTPFSWPTLLVNVLGCFAIGWIHAWASRQPAFRPELLLLLTTGLCGGFTTFSAFAYENIVLMKSGNHVTALIYVAFSILGGLLATWAGMQAGR